MCNRCQGCLATMRITIVVDDDHDNTVHDHDNDHEGYDDNDDEENGSPGQGVHPEPSLQPPPRQRGGIGFIAHIEPFHDDDDDKWDEIYIMVECMSRKSDPQLDC